MSLLPAAVLLTMASCGNVVKKEGAADTSATAAAAKDTAAEQTAMKIDNQVLLESITETLGGEIGTAYADPYGEGRIRIVDGDA